MFLVVLFALLQFSWSVSVISNLGGGLETLCIGVFLYSLGGYIKEYNPFKKVRLWGGCNRNYNSDGCNSNWKFLSYYCK